MTSAGKEESGTKSLKKGRDGLAEIFHRAAAHTHPA